MSGLVFTSLVANKNSPANYALAGRAVATSASPVEWMRTRIIIKKGGPKGNVIPQ